MKKEKEVIDENVEYFLREGMLPNGIKPIVMSNVEEYLRSQGGINTQELLEVINKYSKKDITINELINQVKTNSNLKRNLIESPILFLTVGYNDLIYKISLEENINKQRLKRIIQETRQEYDNLIKEIRKYYKKEIICIGYYQPNKENDNLNLGIKNINFYLESQKEITYIDTYKLLSNKEKYFSNPNSYYPNKLGYQKISQEIIYQMKKDLKN